MGLNAVKIFTRFINSKNSESLAEIIKEFIPSYINFQILEKQKR